MTDFQVDRAGLRSAATAHDDGVQGLAAAAEAIQPPDNMMLGVFASPLVAIFGPMITDATRSLTKGLGQMHASYAANLRSSASSYEATEEQAAADAAAMIEL